MAAPLFFVPVALAAGKVFFKFATKKAAQTFRGKHTKAGKESSKTPPKNAQVVTTSSEKGKAIIKDMTKPTTPPSIRPRNPNTTTLPKKPKKGSGAGAATVATGAGVAGSSKSTGDTNKKTDSRKEYRPAKNVKPKRTAFEVNIILGGGMNKKDEKKTSASPTSKPKNVPKRKSTVSPTSKPKLYRTINPNTGKLVDKKVTAAQHLANLDKYKANQKKKNKGKK